MLCVNCRKSLQTSKEFLVQIYCILWIILSFFAWYLTVTHTYSFVKPVLVAEVKSWSRKGTIGMKYEENLALCTLFIKQVWSNINCAEKLRSQLD